jgi:hypothetical protein
MRSMAFGCRPFEAWAIPAVTTASKDRGGAGLTALESAANAL